MRPGSYQFILRLLTGAALFAGLPPVADGARFIDMIGFTRAGDTGAWGGEATFLLANIRDRRSTVFGTALGLVAGTPDFKDTLRYAEVEALLFGLAAGGGHGGPMPPIGFALTFGYGMRFDWDSSRDHYEKVANQVTVSITPCLGLPFPTIFSRYIKARKYDNPEIENTRYPSDRSESGIMIKIPLLWAIRQR